VSPGISAPVTVLAAALCAAIELRVDTAAPRRESGSLRETPGAALAGAFVTARMSLRRRHDEANDCGYPEVGAKARHTPGDATGALVNAPTLCLTHASAALVL
jgi:hypothetical protein